MSLGPYDPNATPIIPLTMYQQAAIKIQRAREYINQAEQRNEAGRANFDQLEREELELKKQVDLGILAHQRLLEIHHQKAKLEAFSSSLFANQPASTSRIEEMGTGNQAPPGITSLGDSVPTTYSTSQNSQQGSSTHQASYIQDYSANVPGHAQSRPMGYHAGPPHYIYAPGPSLPTRQYSAMPPADAHPKQNQVPSHMSRVPSGHEESNTSHAGPSRRHRSTAFQATAPPATSSQTVRYPIVANVKPNYAQASVPIPSMHQSRNVPAISQLHSNAEHLQQQYMHSQYHAAEAGSLNTSSSLANALGSISINPSNVPPLPNNPSMMNPSYASARGSATVPIREHAPSSPRVPSPVPNSFSSSVSQPNQGVPAGHRSDLRTASQESIPLPRDPTPENILAMRNSFKGWAEKASADPTNTNNYLYLFDCKVFSVRESDQSIWVVMKMKEKTHRYTLDEFLDRFIQFVFRQSQAAGPLSSAAQTNQPVDSKVLSSASSAPSASTPVATATIPPLSAAAPGATQNQSAPALTTLVLTPSSVPNTVPPKVTLTSPRQANLKSLAKDILYGLGKKRPREPSMPSENAAQPVKKRASGVAIQASRTSEPRTTPTKFSTVPLDEAPPPRPLSRELLTDVPNQPTNSVSLEGSTTSGPSATLSSAPAPTLKWVDPALASSNSSVPQHSAETLRVIEYIPKVAEPANTHLLKTTSGPAAPSEAGGTSVPITSQPPITIVSSSSSSAQTPSKLGAKANSVFDLTSPPILGPVASSSTLVTPQSPEPLFLPSSSPEPQSPLSPLKPPDNFDLTKVQRLEMPESGIMEGKKTATGKSRSSVYVLVPPAPEYLVRYREQIRKKVAKGISISSQEATVQELKRGTRTSSVPTSASVVEEEDFTYALEGQHLSPQDEDERESVRLACTRLQEVPCRWNGCDCKLNSVESLIRHLNQHKPIPTQYTKSFMCRWTQCGQQVRFEDKHLERHAMLPLRCAYVDCDDSFRSAAQLLKHVRLMHKDGILKSSYKPSHPKSLPLQPLPNNGIVPSYLLVTDLVEGEAMSKERHEAVGRWVARNITTSGVQSRSRPRKVKSAKSSNQDTADAKNDYEFLTTRTTRYSTYVSTPVDLDLADLDSANISRMIDEEAFTLWSSEVEGDVDGSAWSPPDSPLFSPRISSGRFGEINLETEDNPRVDTWIKPHNEDDSDDDENAAVEIMLTDMTLPS